jgi:hypothetical protein
MLLNECGRPARQGIGTSGGVCAFGETTHRLEPCVALRGRQEPSSACAKLFTVIFSLGFCFPGKCHAELVGAFSMPNFTWPKIPAGRNKMKYVIPATPLRLGFIDWRLFRPQNWASEHRRSPAAEPRQVTHRVAFAVVVPLHAGVPQQRGQQRGWMRPRRALCSAAAQRHRRAQPVVAESTPPLRLVYLCKFSQRKGLAQSAPAGYAATLCLTTRFMMTWRIW